MVYTEKEDDDDELSIEFVSNIDYANHIKAAKMAARAFSKPGKHNFKILKPIPEDDYKVSHVMFKSIFERCRQDLRLMSI